MLLVQSHYKKLLNLQHVLGPLILKCVCGLKLYLLLQNTAVKLFKT